MAAREPAPFERPRFARECDIEQLGPALGARFEPLPLDPFIERFIDGGGPAPHGKIRGGLFSMLRGVISDFDANGVLGIHPMALLGPTSWASLIGGPRRSLLDVGAGSGDVTRHAKTLFETIVCLETSFAMRMRLRARGFDALDLDLGARRFDPLVFRGSRFDVIALLNVLDRCERPRTLLENARSLMDKEGILLVSLPLPVRPHVDRGGVTVDPDEPLGGRGATFEPALRDFVERTLAPSGFEVRRLARAPYLSRGDHARPLAVLDAALIVAAPSGAI